MKLLLEYHTKVKTPSEIIFLGWSPIYTASLKGHIEIVKLLLAYPDTKINNDCYQALSAASGSGKIEIVKLLLEQPDIEINKTDEEGNTALYMASYCGNTEIVKLLLEQRGIDINKNNNNNNNYSPICAASFNGHSEIVKLLLKKLGILIDEKFLYNKSLFKYTNGEKRKKISRRFNNND